MPKKSAKKIAKKPSQKMSKSPTSAQVKTFSEKVWKSWVEVVSAHPLVRKKNKALRKTPTVFVDFSLVNDRKIQDLNLSYRGKDQPTDVLSFPVDEWAQAQGMFGDVVISWQTLIRQAKQNQESWKHEFYLLATHGLLHVFGFDHEVSPKAAKEMASVEHVLLSELGLQIGLIDRTNRR